jgi:hypothetical protein
MYLGHNSRVEHTEASTTLAGGRHKKRALELYHLQEEEEEDDEDAYWEEEATFMAGADGAYTTPIWKCPRGSTVATTWV